MIDHPALEVANRAYQLVPLPLHLLALAAVVLAARRREWTTVVLAGAALGWVALVAAMTVVGGYPGLSRFLVPPAAVVCILGGVGVVSLGDLATPPVRTAVVGLLLVALLPAGIWRARALDDDVTMSRDWARVAGDLGTAVREAGGAERVACRNPVINHAAQTQLAWILRLPFSGVRTRADRAGLVFVTEDPVANVPPAATVDLPRRALARTDEWTVYVLGAVPPLEQPCRSTPAS